MRILQLDVGGHRIEFHPYLSVLRGIDDRLRAELVDALREVSSGRSNAAGLVEAHGVVLELTAATLALLDLDGRENGDLDVVVRREQLPGQSAASERAVAEARERVARAEAEVEAAALALRASRDASSGESPVDDGGQRVPASPDEEVRRLTERREALEAALAAARAEVERAKRDQDIADERVEHARALRAESARACSVAAGALESARGARDPFAAASLEAARERLQALEAQDDDAPVSAPAVEPVFADDVDLAAEVQRLEGRRLELEAALLALDTVDPYPVEIALAQHLSGASEGELVASEAAIRLADEWATIAGAGDDDEAETNTGSAIAVARRRLDAARAAVFDAERAVRLPEVDRLDVESLENAHEQVLINQERSEKRLAGGRAKVKLDEARQAEQEILDRLGFRTYTEFVMGTSIVNVDPEREHRLEAARAELSAAEDAVAMLEADVDAELARAALVARRREIRAEAVALLGRDPGEDVEWALRHHRVRVQVVDERVGRLREALTSAGLAVDDEDIPTDLLVDLATIWLEEQSHTSAHREHLEHELAEVDASLGPALAAARARREAEAEADDWEGVVDPGERRRAQLEEARAAVRAAEQRLERQSQLETDIADRKAELEAATRAEEAVAAALIAAEAEATAAAEDEHAAEGERARLEGELAAAVEDERRARQLLGEVTTRLSHASETDDPAALAQAVADAEGALERAEAALDEARRDLAQAEAAAGTDVHDDGIDDSFGFAPRPSTAATTVEELEWYLLSRVAAQRAVSYAGSVPLVIDDALAEVRGEDLAHLLSRLERMSSAVQVIVVSEDDEVAAWADSVGTDRAMTLYPTPI